VRNRLRFLLFVILALSLVVVLDRATIRLFDREHHLASARVDEPENKVTQSRDTNLSTSPQTWIIPTYPAGELPVAQPVEKHIKKPPVKKQVNKKDIKTKPSPKKPEQISPRQVASEQKGDFPVLEVGYDAIGFASYLDAIERVGHFFLISNTDQGSKIGSEISLKSRTVYRHKIDMANLAIKRPHLVSDDMIRDRLSGFSLPDDVQTDSIILVFSKPFDDLLWDTIVSVLSKNDLSLGDISRIDGGYVKEREDIFLLIRSAEIRNTGEEIQLNRRLRISLG
jgi:hypothetical protein